MDVLDVCAALSNETRLQLITILIENGPMTSIDAHNKFVERFEDRRRQSIHSALETLVEAEVVEKSYSKEDGGIVYEVRNKNLSISLETMKVSPE
jgi:Fe2+ or Zn2+ uptake regulation protein